MVRRLCASLSLSLFCAVAVLACDPVVVEPVAPVGPVARVAVAAPVRTCSPQELRLGDKPQSGFLFEARTRASVVEHAAIEPTLLEQERLPIERGDVTDHRQLGATLIAQHRIDEAITAFRTASWLTPPPMSGASSVLPISTVARLIEVCAVCRRQSQSRWIISRVGSCSRALLTKNDGAGARQQAEEWVRLQPTSPAARQALGRAFTQLGMWHEAIEQYRLVVALQPDNAFAHNNLGFAALQLGKTELAVAHLERILGLQPQQGYMLNNLGVAYERQGRRGDAHAAFARAAELSPKYAQAALNRDRLQHGLNVDSRTLSAALLERFRRDSAVEGASGASSDPAVEGE